MCVCVRARLRVPMTRALCLQALVRVESVIREERESEALDVLSIMCEQVSERLALIATEKTCPADLRETVGVRVRPRCHGRSSAPRRDHHRGCPRRCARSCGRLRVATFRS